MRPAADEGSTGRSRSAPVFLLAEFAAYAGCLVLLVIVLGQLLLAEIRVVNARDTIPDMQQWSETRKSRYFEAVAADRESLLGRLYLPSLSLDVPVYAKASDLNMDRGAGIIDGMAYPHESGHIGIAGHRDGYFRAMKDLRKNDLIVLETLVGRREFRVDELRVIDPDELSYLSDTVDSRLTLLTCYPFYFAGNAPQRFLVRATPVTAQHQIPH